MSYRRFELGELADVIDPHPSHRAPQAVENGCPFAGIGDINENGEINIDKARKVNVEILDEHEQNYYIDKFSIGYGRVATVGKVVRLKPRKNYRYALSPTLAVINPNKDVVDPKYLYYYLISDKFFNEVRKYMTGTTRQSIGIKLLRKIKLDCPRVQEQKAIANILSSLDDKIELNNKINKNLEELAQTLYKQWFVDFEFPNEYGEPYKSSGGEIVESDLGLIPKGWSYETLGKSKLTKLVRSGIDVFADKKIYLATGLTWQQTDSVNTYDWEGALAYAENLEFAGYSDWRLPNAKELQSIVDYNKSLQTTNSAAIDDLFESTSIIDSDGNLNYEYYWTSTTHLDGVNPYGTAVYIAFGEAQGIMNGSLLDVHGAGAQRSDPKSGDINNYPTSFGPQGDIRYVYNLVRCVRG